MAETKKPAVAQSTIGSLGSFNLDKAIGQTLDDFGQLNYQQNHHNLAQNQTRFPEHSWSKLTQAELLRHTFPKLMALGANSDIPQQLIQEAKNRQWYLKQGPQLAYRFSSLVKMPNRQFLLLDLLGSRLYLFEKQQGHWVLNYDAYISIGEKGVNKSKQGDRRTPVGAYQIVTQYQDKDVPPKYGAGALTLSYPNAYDRAIGRTGGGIWIHGKYPDRVNLPQISEGCVVLENRNVDALFQRLSYPVRTWVISVESLKDLPWNALHQLSAKTQARFPSATRVVPFIDKGHVMAFLQQQRQNAYIGLNESSELSLVLNVKGDLMSTETAAVSSSAQ